jgi:hypothetical protein
VIREIAPGLWDECGPWVWDGKEWVVKLNNVYKAIERAQEEWNWQQRGAPDCEFEPGPRKDTYLRGRLIRSLHDILLHYQHEQLVQGSSQANRSSPDEGQHSLRGKDSVPLEKHAKARE